MIQIKKLSKTYSSKSGDVDVLKDIDLNLPRKGFISLIGKSGSGKTTFLNLLGGLDTFDNGEILLQGIKYSDLNDSDWDILRSQYISFIFQEDNLIEDFNIYENLNFVMKNDNYELVLNKLRKFGLEDKIDKYPHELSGGEKQRIAIIRALLKDSKVLLVDEPTGSLDEESAITVLKTLKEVSREKLVFMITHDKENAKTYSDEIFTLKNMNIFNNTKHLNNTQVIGKKIIGGTSLKLKNHQLFRLVIGLFKRKVFKIIQYSFLLMITLFMVGLGFSTLFTNEFSIASDTFISTGMEYVFIKSPGNEYYDGEDFSEWQENISSSVRVTHNDFSLHLYDNSGKPFMDVNYKPTINAFMNINQDVELLAGNLPVFNNEIIVSDYYAESLLQNEIIDGTNIESVLNKNIPSTELIIIGIFKTDYLKHSSMLKGNNYYMYSEDFSENDKNELNYKIDEFYSVAYISESFDFSLSNIGLNGVVDSSNDNRSISGKLYPRNSIGIDMLTTFSETTQNTNDLYISKYMLFELLLDDSNYDLNSYEEFISYWALNEEEITSHIIGESITIAFETKSQMYLNNGDSFNINTREFLIKGIVNTDHPVSNMYIDSSIYNEGFKNNFSLIIPITDNSLLNENALRVIRENGYFYESHLSNSIIKYMDEDGYILSVIAFSVSGLFIVFSVLLFNNLLSRDIMNKKKEIGLFRSLGIKQQQIFKLFILEIMLITTIAFIGAVLLQPIGIHFLNLLVSSGDDKLSIIKFDLRMVILLGISSVGFTLISILNPYKKMKSLTLIDTIKGNNI